jgi:hypothetical protein
MIGVLPWCLLFLAIVLLKENRCLQSLWILLPVILLRLMWTGIAKLCGMPSEPMSMLGLLIDCLLAGFVLNWLLGERIGNRNRFITWLLSLLVFTLVFCVSMLSFGLNLNPVKLSMEVIQLSIFVGLTVGVLLVSFTLAGFKCRKRFGPVRFSVWTAVWVLLTTVGFFAIFGIIQAAMYNMSMSMIVIQILMIGLIYGGILIVCLLPFEILWFKNTFWQKRFEAVFGLKRKTVIQIDQSPDTDTLPIE